MASASEPKQQAPEKEIYHEEEDSRTLEDAAGAFRGVAAVMRAYLPIVRSGVKAVGNARPLAFASEGAVAADSLIPRFAYYGAWALSGIAVVADITNRTWDAPPERRPSVALYHTLFHIPASLVLPAVIIHQVVHTTQHAVSHRAMFQSLSPRTKAIIPVAAALASIIPVVPIVDHSVEYIMEPTLGKYLGIEVVHHAGQHHEHHA
eukprot:gb/GEZN01020269.1/.p1 GENE.gb/GEZN01020269.1/~~gb/GEZN01020269.1/.p1  ORF type:complete len:213 (+),score=15.65 gb/GEZN01020269.1/:23-640(+)